MTDLTPEHVRALLAQAVLVPQRHWPHQGELRTVIEVARAVPDLARALLQAWAERDEARAIERARIVAWLRRVAADADDAFRRELRDGRPEVASSCARRGAHALDFADAIESGEHSPDRGKE